MWITVVAIVLVVAMLVGPIMMLQPNSHQKRLARLRSLAAKHGLQIHIAQNPASGDPRQIAVYSFRLPPGDYNHITLKPWSLSRQNLEHELNFFADWDWVGAGRPNREKRQPLRDWLLELPAAIRAVEVEEHRLSVYWTESGLFSDEDWEVSSSKSIDFIAARLLKLLQLLSE